MLCRLCTKLLREVRKQLIDAFLLLLENVVKALVHLIAVLLDEALDCLLMETLVQCWVFGVHVNFAIRELETLYWFLVEYNVERDLFTRLRY